MTVYPDFLVSTSRGDLLADARDLPDPSTQLQAAADQDQQEHAGDPEWHRLPVAQRREQAYRRYTYGWR